MKKSDIKFSLAVVVMLVITALFLINLGTQKTGRAGYLEPLIEEMDYEPDLSEAFLRAEPDDKKSHGYIVELEDEPLVRKSVESRRQKETVQYIGMSSLRVQTTTESTTIDNLKEDLMNHKTDLEAKKRTLKEKIAEKLSKTTNSITGNAVAEEEKELKVIAEYQNVLNALVLDITSDEAEQLKDIQGVKSIYPNEEVTISLTESVPLIGADTAWQMNDAGGNNLTGEGITIGVIDTGIDYFHEDFGGYGDPHEGNIVVNKSNGQMDYYYSLFEDKIVYTKNITLATGLSRPKIHIYTISSGEDRIITPYDTQQSRPMIHGDLIVWQGKKFNNYDIFLYNISSGEELRITTDVSDQILPVVFNDKIAWIDARDVRPNVYLYDLSENAERKISNNVRGINFIAMYGDVLAWSGSEGTSYYLYIYNITSNETKEVLIDYPVSYGISVYENKVVWSGRKNSNYVVYLYDISTEQKTQLSDDNINGMHPQINGNKIVWYDSFPNVYLYDLETNEKIRVTCTSSLNMMPKVYGDTLLWSERDAMFSYMDRFIAANISMLNKFCSVPFPTEKVVDGYDFTTMNKDPLDNQGHGTHCAATAAGNGILKGVAPDAKIVSYKVLNRMGSGTYAGIISAIERSTDPNQDGDFSDHLDVISLSLGGSGNPDDPLSKSIDTATELGIVAVIAAGNSGPGENTIGSPGTARSAITVGASYDSMHGDSFYNISKLSDCFDPLHTPTISDLACFSSRGPVSWSTGKLMKPDIAAPGVEICAAQAGNSFTTSTEPNPKRPDIHRCVDDVHVAISGTSMATPHVAGGVALMKQKFPEWTSLEIKNGLKITADDLGLPYSIQGAGRMNLTRALSLQYKPVTGEIETTGLISGTSLDIMGTAKGEAFTNYSIFVSSDTTLFAWSEVCNSSSQIQSGTLCQWNLSTYSEGDYILKLVVNSLEGMITEFSYITLQNVRIIHPLRNEILPTWKNIVVNGTAEGEGFVSYSLKLCNNATLTCIEDIHLSDDGNHLVKENLLGTIDASSILESGFYNLALDVNYTDGTNISDNITVYIDTNIHNGWPVHYQISGELYYTKNQPLLSDINGDNKKEIIFAQSSTLGVYTAEGVPLSGWPATISTNSGASSFSACMFYYEPSAADIDHDGEYEIVVLDSCNYIHLFNTAGKEIIEPKKVLGSSYSTSLSDVDADGYLEIIVPSTLAKITILDYSSNTIENQTITLIPLFDFSSHSMFSTPSFADFDQDGADDIAIISYGCTYESCTYLENYTSWIWLLNSSGAAYPGWPKAVNGYGYNAEVAVVDIDDDNEYEIITGTLGKYAYLFELNGSHASGWPVKSSSSISTYSSGPAIGNVYGDERMEIVLLSYSDKYCVNTYALNGTLLPGFPICKANTHANSQADPAMSLTLANLDEDAISEIIYGDVNPAVSYDPKWLYAFNGDGSIVDNFPIYAGNYYGSFFNTYPVADIDNDGYNEIVVLKPIEQEIYVYKTNGVSGSDPWPSYHHDERHTGRYGCLTRRYFLDADNDTFGNRTNYDESCTLPLDGNYVLNDKDCLDADELSNPNSVEVCDNVDNDCNGLIDDDVIRPCGEGSCLGISVCVNGEWQNCSTDNYDEGVCAKCSWNGTIVYDDTQEDDCKSVIPAINTCTYHADNISATLDYYPGFNSICAATHQCVLAPYQWQNNITHVCNIDRCGAQCTNDTQCDDNNITTIDSCLLNCTCSHVTHCVDLDGDRFNSTGGICGRIDCNDRNVLIKPNATELCNNIDDDCDSLIDENVTCNYTIRNKVIGTKDTMAVKPDSFYVKVDNSESFAGRNFTGSVAVEMGTGTKTLLKGSHNFSSGPLSLVDVSVIRGKIANNNNYIIIHNLNINEKKELHLEKANSASNAVCMLDLPNLTLAQLQAFCINVSCEKGQSTTMCSDKGSYFVISNLWHSGVIEEYATGANLPQPKPDRRTTQTVTATLSPKPVAVTQNTAQTQNSPALAVTTRNSNNRASEMSDAELSDEQPSPPDTDEAEDDNDLETTSSFFTDKSTPLIVVILSIIIGGVLVGIILMTKGAHQTPASKLDSEIQLKIQEDNYSVQNKIELESYVRKYMQMNYSKENIIKACSYVGWDSELVGKIIEKTYLERKDKN